VTITTRTLKATPTPALEAVTGAGEQLEIARQALLKAAHHLDDSATRCLHEDALELKDRANGLSIRLTEFVDG
jgi:hypothetical protein